MHVCICIYIYVLMYTALYFIILCGVIFHYQELMHYGSTIGTISCTIARCGKRRNSRYSNGAPPAVCCTLFNGLHWLYTVYFSFWGTRAGNPSAKKSYHVFFLSSNSLLFKQCQDDDSLISRHYNQGEQSRQNYGETMSETSLGWLKEKWWRS